MMQGTMGSKGNYLASVLICQSGLRNFEKSPLPNIHFQKWKKVDIWSTHALRDHFAHNPEFKNVTRALQVHSCWNGNVIRTVSTNRIPLWRIVLGLFGGLICSFEFKFKFLCCFLLVMFVFNCLYSRITKSRLDKLEKVVKMSTSSSMPLASR